VRCRTWRNGCGAGTRERCAHPKPGIGEIRLRKAVAARLYAASPTYAGHPLYRFVQDTRPGQTTGQGLDQFGAEWYVLSPAGKKIEKGDD
jgi:Secreted repeat of unknown function